MSSPVPSRDGKAASDQSAHESHQSDLPDELRAVREYVEAVGGLENARRAIEQLSLLRRAA